MSPTFCNRCGDALEEGCDPWDELEQLDALSQRIKFKRYDLKRGINQLHSPIAPTFCNRCRDAVEEGCDPWDKLDALDALSERLKFKRYILKRKINRFHCVIIRQLPLDVTSTIFEFCKPDFTDHHISFFTKEDFTLPLSLGAICSYWREIAWSTPSLWSSLVVRLTSKHDSNIVAGLAREWLARSGELPLSIRICSGMHARASEAVSALADIINQYSTRWSDLDLNMPSYICKYFHAIDNHAPILKSIRFFCRADLLDLNLQNFQNFQLTCPRLERAYFSFVQMKNTNIQLDNLTHLTLHSISIIDSFVILRKTPRLVFCKVSGFCTRYSVGLPVLTSLRSLQLDLNTTAADDFLNNLVAPHLEEFSLPRHYTSNPLMYTSNPSMEVPSMEVIASFFRRSACSLRSFSAMTSSFSAYFEDFLRLFQSMPSLNTLSITTTNYIQDTPEDHDLRDILQLVAKVLSSQSTSSLQQEFLPNLHILEYTGNLCLRPGNYDDLLYSLPTADNRDAAVRHGPFHLLKLNLHPATRISENVISYLSSLVERGVRVNVVTWQKKTMKNVQ